MSMMYDDSDDDDEPPALVDLAPAAPPALVDDDVDDDDDDDDPPSTGSPCPVTILSGFLGSGKTTLIQYILRDPNHGKRIAVIENEFGEGLAVESMIARDGVNNSLQDLIELPNGCICCTVKDSLVETLENLITKKSDLDYIIIEASGMANPGPIASVFWLDDALESRLQLDGIVTLVDAYHILQQLETTEEAAQQVAYADRILINKMDLVPDNNDMEMIQSTIRQLHPSAPFRCTTYSQVPDLDWILGANCFGGAKRLEELDTVWCQVQQETSATNTRTGHSHDHSHDHAAGDADCQLCEQTHHHGHQQQQQHQQPAHRHTASVVTVALEHPGSVDLDRLNKWLADILWPDQDQTDKVLTAMLHQSMTETIQRKLPSTQLFRIKGIVSVRMPRSDAAEEEVEVVDDDDDDDDKRYTDPVTLLDQRRYIVQAVHDIWEVHPASDNLQWEADEERVCKMVLIGKGLQSEELRAGFLACFVS
jgi:G3E family GTPase